MTRFSDLGGKINFTEQPSTVKWTGFVFTASDFFVLLIEISFYLYNEDQTVTLRPVLLHIFFPTA